MPGSRSGPLEAPGPRGLPLLGLAVALRRDFLGTLTDAMQEHGDVVRLAAGPRGLRRTFHGIFHPDGVHRVLAANADGYRKDNVAYEEVRWLLGEGLLTSQDERWRRQRRLLQPLFTRRQLAAYVRVMDEEARAVVSSWRPVAITGGSVDLSRAMTRLSLRVVLRTLFGSDADRVFPVIERVLPVIGRYAVRRSVAPVRVPHAWPTPANLTAADVRRTLYGLCDELIQRRRVGTRHGDDLLDVLLDARDERGRALEDAEIRDQVLVFLLAGHDTTGLALTYTLHLLGRHVEVQERVRDEARKMLGEETPTPAVLSRLGYTTMVLQEAMRLYPPVYALGRRISDGERFGSYTIPPGADVVVAPWVTHRHPAFWPDPERFDPQRFSPELQAQRHAYAYVPFGGGPHACIGRHFALLEATLVLARIMRELALTTTTDRPRLDPQITLHPDGAVLAGIALADTVATTGEGGRAASHG
jgi:cytochrome P450